MKKSNLFFLGLFACVLILQSFKSQPETEKAEIKLETVTNDWAMSVYDVDGIEESHAWILVPCTTKEGVPGMICKFAYPTAGSVYCEQPGSATSRNACKALY